MNEKVETPETSPNELGQVAKSIKVPSLEHVKFTLELSRLQDQDKLNVCTTVINRMFQWVLNQGHSVVISRPLQVNDLGIDPSKGLMVIEIEFQAMIIADGMGEVRRVSLESVQTQPRASKE